jgi:hypothetical protein
MNRKFIASFFLVFTLSCSLIFSLNADSQEQRKKSFSAFPILMYDTDIGFGYGGKAILKNFFKRDESFDLVLFNSSKGEKWYVFTFSIPDFEIRQGKVYPLSFDLKAEYDKILKNNFFGIGSDSKKENQIIFTSEMTQLQMTFGRGFSERFVGQISYILKNIRYFNIKEGNSALVNVLKEVGTQFSPFASFIVRYDSSDSQINPTRGLRLMFQGDFAFKLLGNKNAEFQRYTLDFRKYTLLFGKKDVFAFRILSQSMYGENIPIYEMTTLGGGSTMNAMRGFMLNRFLDKNKILLNTEYRFPIWKKLGGNLLIDTGRVTSSFKYLNFKDWKINYGWGLRYYLKNFVVRFDMGFSNEGIGIYFNFGHLF